MLQNMYIAYLRGYQGKPIGAYLKINTRRAKKTVWIIYQIDTKKESKTFTYQFGKYILGTYI